MVNSAVNFTSGATGKRKNLCDIPILNAFGQWCVLIEHESIKSHEGCFKGLTMSLSIMFMNVQT